MWIRPLLLALSALAHPARAAETFQGVVEATVVAIRDGDTFLADASIWPGQTIRIDIRLRGIDAPETNAPCATEQARAKAATDALAQLIPEHSTVLVSEIGSAKYFGRVLATVRTPTGVAVSEALLQAGLVEPYAGGRRVSRCG